MNNEQNLEGIVRILDSSGQYNSGTGFFVSAKGYILTCAHVLDEGGYTNVDQDIYFKIKEKDEIFTAKLIDNNRNLDLALVKADIGVNTYYSFFEQDCIGIKASCFGFPYNSKSIYSASITIDNIHEDGKYLQIGNANNITSGFSGAPIFYNTTVVGVVKNITSEDKFGRLTNIAIAVSAKYIVKSFGKYVNKKEICVGFGKKEQECTNYVVYKQEGLCEECYKAQFEDTIKTLYRSQNYKIENYQGYFIAKLKYGISTYYDVVFILVKYNEKINLNDIYSIILLREKVNCHNAQSILVTNTTLDEDSKELVQKKEIIVKTKEELFRSLFDYVSYKEDLLKHVNSLPLASHYVELYVKKDKLEKEILIDEEYVLYNNSNIDFFDSISNQFENLNTEKNIDLDLNKIYLKEYVSSFLRGSNRALLILGEYGSGKSSFCYNYSLQLLEDFTNGKGEFFPILIKLRRYNKAIGIKEILTDYFVNELAINNFNISTFQLLLKHMNVVLIFDGYDEIGKRVDFDIKYEVLKDICTIAGTNSKVILTCRPNFFQNEEEFREIFHKSYILYEPGEKNLLEFKECMIQELDEEQICEYIQSYYEDFNKNGISYEDIHKWIKNIHDLMDLAKRPFLLYMILNTLPQLVSIKNGNDLVKINAAQLYETYTDNWIKREDRKKVTLITRNKKEEFCKELAFVLYSKNVDYIDYKDLPERIKNYFYNLNSDEEIHFFSHDIQNCSFLTSDRSGEFRFIHKSFMEYFVADYVVNKLILLNSTDNRNEKINKINMILNQFYISTEICFFIIDIMEIKNKYIVLDIIEFIDDLKYKAQANILSIISKMNFNIADYILNHNIAAESLLHADFSKANFKNAVIVNKVFDNIHFYFNLFDNVYFVNCSFKGTVFEKSTMEKVKFYHCDFCNSIWKKNTKLVSCTFEQFKPLKLLQPLKSFLDYGDNFEVDINKRIANEYAIKGNLSMYYNNNFYHSLWEEVCIENCCFFECYFVENTFNSCEIKNTGFSTVDFENTKILGRLIFENNKLENTYGELYEF